MRKTLLVLSLLGLMSQPVLSSSADTMNQVTPGTPVGGAAAVCPVTTPCPQTTGGAAPVGVATGYAVPVGVPTGYAAPVQVPIERKAPWWKFWKKTEVKYEPACPTIQAVPTGGAACVQPMATPQAFTTPQPSGVSEPVTPTGGAAPVRGYW